MANIALKPEGSYMYIVQWPHSNNSLVNTQISILSITAKNPS